LLPPGNGPPPLLAVLSWFASRRKASWPFIVFKWWMCRCNVVTTQVTVSWCIGCFQPLDTNAQWRWLEPHCLFFQWVLTLNWPIDSWGGYPLRAGNYQVSWRQISQLKTPCLAGLSYILLNFMKITRSNQEKVSVSYSSSSGC
jgi:hypothetical protein